MPGDPLQYAGRLGPYSGLKYPFAPKEDHYAGQEAEEIPRRSSPSCSLILSGLPALALAGFTRPCLAPPNCQAPPRLFRERAIGRILCDVDPSAMRRRVS